MTPVGLARATVGALRRAALRVQLPVVLSLVPVVAGLHGIAVVDVVVPDAMDGAEPEVVDRARRGAQVVVAAVVAVVAAACAAAGLLLRGTISSVVERLHAAAEALARGDVSGRVSDGRRDELGELGRAIDVLGDRLRRLEQARRRTLACVSHELRTPLTIVQGHAFTLARTEPDTSRRRRLELVQAEAVRLADLVDELVDAASLHAGGARLEPGRVDLAAAAAAAADRFADTAAAAGIDITVSADRRPRWIEADARRLDQALGNLLANAVRHAPSGSSIDVRVELLPDRRRRVVVSNRSEPIEPEVLSRIFEPFVQGGTRSGSVGLGLAITRAIAEAHGGQVSIDEDAARGGLVEVCLALPAPTRTSTVAIDAGHRRRARARAAFAGADA